MEIVVLPDACTPLITALIVEPDGSEYLIVNPDAVGDLHRAHAS